MKLLGCVLAICAGALAQSPAIGVHDAGSGDVRATKPDLRLIPQGSDARPGEVWVRKSEAGLVISGRVGGAAVAFPGSRAELMGGEHVELWLSVTPDPVLPPIGWGHQFGDVLLPHGEASCPDTIQKDEVRGVPDPLAKCMAWARKQKHYRAYFSRLFTRQWQFAPGLAVETFGTPAYQLVHELGAVDALPRELEPVKSTPAFQATPLATGGYDFEIQVPWELFLPAGQLRLQDIRLAVEVFGAAQAGTGSGAFSTTVPGRNYGEVKDFSLLTFDHPRVFQLTRCSYPLQGLDMRDEIQPAYFFPRAASVIRDVFILENYRAGYAYEPSGLSPKTRGTHFFVTELGRDRSVCGPILRYLSGDQAKNLVIEDSEDDQESSGGVLKATSTIVIDEDGFAARELKDGAVLMKSGPRKYFSRWGSGQCGGCPRAAMEIYVRDPDGTIGKVFEEETVVDNDEDFDIQLSSDWSRIGVFRFQKSWGEDSKVLSPAWKDDMYCWQGGTFEKCGPERHIPAPNPRTLSFSPAQ